MVGNVNYFCGHNTQHCLTLDTTLLFGLHYVVVRSGFVVSFLSNLKAKPSGHSFWCGFPNFHLHTKLHFSVLFFGVFRAHTKLYFSTRFSGFPLEHTTWFSAAHITLFFGRPFFARAHNLVLGRTNYSVFQSHTIFCMVAIN